MHKSPRCPIPALPCLLSCLLPLAAIAAPPPAGDAPVVMPLGGFAIDGNLLANTLTAGIGDWVANTNLAPGSGLGVLSINGIPLDPTRTFHVVDPFNDTSNDRIFAGGSKWVDNPNTWGWTTSKPSSKTDINNALLHLSTDTNGHIWAVLAADRFSTSGDSYIDFEFLQNPLTRNANGTFTSAGPDGGRTTNDILLSLAFTGGGKVADFFAWRWSPSGAAFAYTDITSVLPANGVFVALNSNTIATPYSAFGTMSYAANAFAEAAIDLTALLGNFNQCETFGFKTIMIKTKASASSSAGIEDFIDPIQYNLNIGPAADAGPDQVRCTEGAETAFELSGTAANGIQMITNTTWSVVDGNAVIDAPNSLITTARVSSASATLRLTVTQVNGCSKSDDVVLSVQQPPVCAITGAANTCLRTTNTFNAPAGMTTYAWTLSGNGAISGPTNQVTLKVVAGDICGANYTIALTARSNACTVSCATQVTVVDTTAPVLTCPPDQLLDCPANTTTNATGVATATDSCSRVTLTYSDSTTNGCGASQIIARTWTATDECGNAVSCVQTITVRDITPPTISCPTNRTLDCPANTTPANTGSATATDLCGSASVSFTDSVTNPCGGTQIITRRWTATDPCGNQSSCTQIITVRDITPPTITCPATVRVNCAGAMPSPNTNTVTASDTCGTGVTVAFVSDVVSASNCLSRFTLTRTYRATDACGNSATCSQTIIVNDTNAPALTCPASVTLEFPANVNPTNTGTATATDACGGSIVSFSDVVTTNCGVSRMIARTWTAVDSCLNTTSCVQTITIRDTTAPMITCPPNATVACGGNTTPAATGTATATDLSGTATVTHTDTVTTNCGNTFTISRRWTATDACSNAASCTQTIAVRDTTPPSITCPANVTLECPANISTNNTGVATASDTCSTVAVTFSDSNSTVCGNARVVSRTWRATDACGNSSTCVQTLTIRDTAPPTLIVPTNRTVECGTSVAPGSTGQATATDVCNAVTVNFSDSVSNSCGNARTILRRWVAMDSCNNSNVAFQTITVRDTTPPTLTLPANRTLNCPGDTRTNNTGVATATDACGGVSISYSDVVSNSCGITKTIRRTWTVVDQCGNSANGLQTIIVQDTAPTMSCPSVSVQCVDDVPAPYTNIADFRAAGGVANDPCDADLAFVLVSNSVMVGSCPGRITRVYRVTDDCGLTAQCTQTVIVDDTIAPTLTCAPSVTVECGSPLDPAVLGNVTATDNCDTNVSITYSDVTIQSTYDLNWYAADPAANSAPYLPTYLKLAPGSLPCPAGGRAPDPLRNAVAFGPTPGQLDALTSLSGESMKLGQILPFEAVIDVSGGPGPEHGTIEFTTSWSTYTTSNDRFGFDKNYKVYCAFVDSADIGSVDPHANAKVESFSSTIINAGDSDEKIQGTFRVSGLDTGDRVIVEVWMVLMSTQPDHVGGTIASELVSAQKVLNPPQPISVGGKTISISAHKFDPLPPPQEQPPLPPLPPQPPLPPGRATSVIDRTWAATDDCGNRSTCVQRITLWDSTPPAISCPTNREVIFGQTWNFDQPAVTDTCGAATLRIVNTITNIAGADSFAVTRSWEAADLSSNTNTCSQTITITGVPPPTLYSSPSSGGGLLLWWTPFPGDFRLEASPTTGSGSWEPLPCTVGSSNGFCYVFVPADDAANFFRLVNTPPRLELLRSTPGNLTLRWPALPTGFLLESTPNLNPSSWTTVTTPPLTINSLNHVEVSTTAPKMFYRLRKTGP